MKKKWTILFAVAVVSTWLVATGCARKDETVGTSTDSTLSLGDFPEATSPNPDSALVFEEPSPEPAPAPSRPRTSPPRTSPRPSNPNPTPSTPVEPAGTMVAAGTQLRVTFPVEVSTKDKVAGDSFTATLAEDVVVDGKVVFPAGSTVNGHVVEAVRPGKTSGRGKMVLAYDSISAYGKSYSIDTVGAPIEGKSGTAGDATKVVGGAAAGAILGKVIGGSGSDAAKGAAVGAAAGTAASLLTRGPDPVVKAGQTLTVSIDRSVTVRVPA
jgi:hypothetical protein